MGKTKKKGNGKRRARGRNRKARELGAFEKETALLSKEHRSLLSLLWAHPDREVKGSEQYMLALELQDQGLVRLTKSSCGCGSYTMRLTPKGEDEAFEAMGGE